ncbi:sulfatase-like hydrolase/transferase [Hyphomicrobium sp. CS1GBMeth3]|uniref:sulfatase-like hydrolase/transferase n=1 Tax=Hyphomicrobium sp. CS1GBMeth3 TaxID=1892845 RepID=UPI0009314DCB|nr:sulfatase-like hydrolase/transferase [Hyphomicrobium sp. CS1GBMeth3]
MRQEHEDTGTAGSGKVKSEAATPTTSHWGPAVWPLHPFLFSAASVLALYTSNLRETSFRDVAPTLITVVGSAALLFVTIGLLLRDFGQRAAVLASIVLVGVLYHTDLFARLNALLGGIVPTTAAVPLMLIVVGLLAILVMRVRFDLTLPNALLNGIALVLLMTPAWSAASYTLATMGLQRSTVAAASTPASSISVPQGAVAAPASASTPDIYYFIFDRYGSQQTLARVYDVDNRPFLESLRAKGFYVALGSHANYPKTAPSLASTFHMDYVDFLAADPLAQRNEWHPIYDMLKNHRVGNFLKSRGYRFVQIGSWWAPTQHNTAADESYSFGFSEFAWLYLRRTIVPKMLDAVAPGIGIAGMTDWDNGQCRRVPLQFAEVKAISERPEPTFTFVHVLLPHEPYVFAADGRCMPPEEVRSRGKIGGYVGQLLYANSLIGDIVDHLLALPIKPIIILQADEGPYPEAYRTGNRSWRKATPEQLAVKTGILNAYYFPDGDYSTLYQDITPVNTFRLLFDKYFGTGYGRLPDRTFAFPDYSSIYDFFDVTEPTRLGDGPAN